MEREMSLALIDQQASICQYFQQHFAIRIADNQFLQEEVYRIRYDVYCEELKYEPKECFPNGKEQDIFDRRAIHCLIQHRESQLYAGCVRLVFPDCQKPRSSLPFEKVCHNIQDNSQFSPSSYAEVSRLAVRSQFRRRAGETQTSSGLLLFDEQNVISANRRKFPLIALSLYLSATSVALSAGMERVFVLMEPCLARQLQHFGFHFSQIGDRVLYHGKRAPYQITKKDLFTYLPSDIRELLEMIHDNTETPSVKSRIRQLLR
jgi:N-acyl amino acid synthase of PEP-CTERM/exosortase system